MKQNKYSIEKALYSYLLHLDSNKQISDNLFCSIALKNFHLGYCSSIFQFKKWQKRKCAIGQSMSYSLFQGTETLEIYMYLLQFTVLLRLIFVRKKKVLFHSKHALNFFSKQTILMATSSIRSSCSTSICKL